MHKGLLVGCFKDLEAVDTFLGKANKMFEMHELEDLVFKVYQGFGEINHKIREDYEIRIFDCQEEFEDNLKEVLICEEVPKQLNLAKRKCLMPPVINLTDEQFGNFLDQNRNYHHKDATLIINDEYCLPTNKTMLAMSSQYFRHLFTKNFKGKNSAHVKLPNANLVVFEMITNYLMLDKLVVPTEMGVGSWIELYEMAEFLCLGRLMTICEQHICSLVHEENCDEIFNFSL